MPLARFLLLMRLWLRAGATPIYPLLSPSRHREVQLFQRNSNALWVQGDPRLVVIDVFWSPAVLHALPVCAPALAVECRGREQTFGVRATFEYWICHFLAK